MEEIPRRLKLRLDRLDGLAALKGWTSDAEIARQLHISQALLCNLRAGRVGVGQKLIRGCLRAFGPAMYDVLFEAEVAEEVAA